MRGANAPGRHTASARASARRTRYSRSGGKPRSVCVARDRAAHLFVTCHSNDSRVTRGKRGVGWQWWARTIAKFVAFLRVHPRSCHKTKAYSVFGEYDRGCRCHGEVREVDMRIVVIGGTGLIGSKVVAKLAADGVNAVAASPATGVNTLTGEGLADVLESASVVVDVSNSPSWEDAAVMEFFVTSTRNLLTGEAAAGVAHHVALSVVGSERLTESGYFRAKIAQEELIKGSSIPYSIVRATQFFEFVKNIADFSMDGNTIHLAPVLIQPIAADDVASEVCRVAIDEPVNGTVEVGGPEQFRLDELVRRVLAAHKDPREVVTDPHKRYYGAQLSERTLVPGDDARLGETRFDDWLSQSTDQIRATSPRPAMVAAGPKVSDRYEPDRASDPQR